MSGSPRTTVVTAGARQEAILTSLAKLEARLREQSRLTASLAEEAQRLRKPVSHAYYMGKADGLLSAAAQVADAYKTAVMVAGDPTVR